MKKTIAAIIAIIMLLSSVSALAETGTEQPELPAEADVVSLENTAEEVGSALISRVWVSESKLLPAITDSCFDYRVYIPEAAESVIFKPTLAEGAAILSATYQDEPVSATQIEKRRFVLSPKKQTTTLTIEVANGEKTVSYSFLLIRDTQKMSQIKNVVFANMLCSPEFSRACFDYALPTVPYETDKLTIKTVTLANKYTSYSIYLNGVRQSSKTISIHTGENRIQLKTKTPLGNTSTYTFTVFRETLGQLSDWEVSIIETAFRLLPEGHPFARAWEDTYGRDIDTYTATKKGIKVSGVPFEFGGGGSIKGFSTRWWNKTSVTQYPAGGLDCAEFVDWVFYQLGYSAPSSSSSLFLAGKTGETRKLEGVRTHLVIPLNEARIGDICYNSKDFSYRSGHGSHSALYIGTANELGIAKALKKYYPSFPMNARLTIDVGWSDGIYYYNMMRKLGISGRSSMCGVGIQFFTSIKQGGRYIYSSPYRTSTKRYSYKDLKTGYTFVVRAGLEENGRLFQAPSSYKGANIANISRPVLP